MAARPGIERDELEVHESPEQCGGGALSEARKAGNTVRFVRR